ncbi:RNA polymerase sigma factor [Variovorax paradoxus]|uniref:Putative RNA polymerase sigma factor FecI n=1 Tax=Variovorax paradoxus TaxID=34073 RepID=A0A0H2MF33_VARPD|nr:RNA polymerase sigma factor [Variovorax paradoxus]KLN55460.1 putative RNA polymerase sigma factor FecI [Variovorax paradoxus]
MRDIVQELVAHYADLRRQLTRDLRDPHYAADIAQSSFERVYAHALKMNKDIRINDAAPDGTQGTGGIESPRALLFRVARNLCVDDARRRKVAQDWVSTHFNSGSRQVVPSCEFIASQQQVLARVVETLETLPPRRREVFLLFRAYGHTRAEIAQQLNITEMAVAKHLLRAAIDCSRVFARLRSELVEQPVVSMRPGFDATFAEDFA